MPVFRAPVDDYRFLLTELFDAAVLSSYPGYEEGTTDLLLAALEEAGKFCEEVLFPLNMSADSVGCHWEDGAVTTPPGYKDAWKAYTEGGWCGVSCHTEHGGQGLPVTLRIAVDEMVCSASLGFSGCPGLTAGVYEGLLSHGSEALKTLYLPKLANGAWSGTMCLTESHAGTDLGIIRTTATPNADGSFTVTGTKIFITAGEHDLAENIIHLVLARLPDAPAGTRGISMFLIPKFIPNADGTLGARNAVHCGNIEHKMGLKGSPTCVMNFDGATGWLVGSPHKGMRGMFTLMNAARLGVGLQGLGLSEVSYQNAALYAKERLQGRALSGPKAPDSLADPIIHHAEIRRGLLWMRSFVEGARALSVWTSMQIDRELRHPDPAEREAAADLVALMTPVIKAFYTDLGFQATNIGMQIFGGHGYVRESGMEQYVRDARIGPIYEGTNYVQALDLVGRKLPEGDGRLLRRYLELVQQELTASRGTPALEALALPLTAALERLQLGVASLMPRALKNPDEAGAGASDLLQLVGYVSLGHMWLRQARVATERLATGGALPNALYRSKIQCARYYMERMLPQTESLLTTLLSSSDNVLSFEEAWFQAHR